MHIGDDKVFRIRIQYLTAFMPFPLLGCLMMFPLFWKILNAYKNMIILCFFFKFTTCALLASRWQWDARRSIWLWEETDWDSWASMFAWMALWLRYCHMTICHTRSFTEILLYEDYWLCITGLFEDLVFVVVSGGGVRLCLAGGTETGQSVSGDLQGGRCDADPWADDWPAEDIGHSQSGHHSSIRRGGSSQVC